jgi:hypothetical protein
VYDLAAESPAPDTRMAAMARPLLSRPKSVARRAPVSMDEMWRPYPWGVSTSGNLMMVARVVAVNPRKGFVAVETDDGITVFELLGGYEVGVGDNIRGDFDTHGGETYFNLTSGEEMDVYVQAIHCTPQNAKRLMS